MKLFKKLGRHIRPNGVYVTHFEPTTQIYIKSINLETGEVAEKLITDYSKHENIIMYKIHDPKNRFKDFHVSEDHSLIVFDHEDNNYKKISPLEILQNVSIYSLVQCKNKNKKKISVKEIEIKLDETMTTGYDFTVVDNFTFSTDDGVFVQDTMALYTPITKEAIEEVKEKMILSYSPHSLQKLGDTFNKDIVAGIYVLTKNPQKESDPVLIKDETEFEKLNPNTYIKKEGIKTTIGRIIFNRVFPKGYDYINEAVNGKKLTSFAMDIFKNYNKEIYMKWCKDILTLSTKYFTIMAPSFSLSDLEIPPHVYKLKEKLKSVKNSEEADLILRQIEKEMYEYLVNTNSNLGVLGEAGAIKSISQVRQILVAKGIISDSEGKTVMPPISDSYSDGLSSKEFFYSGIGSRKGIIDRVINTSETGYISRQLVYALQRVEASRKVKDCGTKKTITLRINDDIAKRIYGRYIINERTNKVEPFDSKIHKNEIIKLRSPLFCKSEKICHICYGDLLYQNKTDYVGILAGHLLGEPLSQTIMKSFHLGGSIKMKTTNFIKQVSHILHKKEEIIVNKSFEQKGSSIYAKTDGIIDIDMSYYLEPKKDVIVKSDVIELKYGYFMISLSDIDLDITLDTIVNVPLKDKIVTDKNNGKITIQFKKDDLILNLPPVPETFSEQVKIIRSLLNGKQPWKSAEHFLMKLYDVYREIAGGIDLVHIEILASNLLRDKGNPSYPARLNQNYHGMVGNLKNIPALESWLQSLNFENINKSIMQGLVYNRPEQETILEEIVSGNL